MAPDLARLQHDVATPLVLITGFADLLAAEGSMSDADRRDYALRIRAAADDLRSVIAAALSA